MRDSIDDRINLLGWRKNKILLLLPLENVQEMIVFVFNLFERYFI